MCVCRACRRPVQYLHIVVHDCSTKMQHQIAVSNCRTKLRYRAEVPNCWLQGLPQAAGGVLGGGGECGHALLVGPRHGAAVSAGPPAVLLMLLCGAV